MGFWLLSTTSATPPVYEVRQHGHRADRRGVPPPGRQVGHRAQLPTS